MTTSSPLPPPVVAAYHYCHSIAEQHARNFSYGARLVPAPKRRALTAVYAFARRVDDIGDGRLDPAAKEERLSATRALLKRVRDGAVQQDDTDPVAVALGDAARRYPIPLGALDELIDGVLMDVRGHTYETWDDLRAYCTRVAGTIGRLSLGVFGVLPGAREAERAPEYADTLGLALQVTNILRDIREDAANGRVYLPAEDLRKFGCPEGPGLAAPGRESDFTGLIRFQVRRARELFAEGSRLLPMLDRRSGACVTTMAGIYHRLLDRIEADPRAVLRHRVTLPAGHKVLVAARGLTGLDARRAARRERL
ncbi:presqualene diphosphate synthase HpnD [Streptomyces johnsoniae]|uniref:Presqualene diphosphate synthase HpnD n=1 Tax=Streptomyces johnsoniae TaxID=3075532 RepID=A0ABU2S9Z6_9ACTN|nr:presqualene diphosphate synthase HpnD [Streptomyces sp. DSM 41886]MDT0444495.1 presqualene diphosphate synthase HpnD [Streptomyces sp. DSM 41886]